MASEETGLKVSGVSKKFGALHALSDVNVRFAPGEVHAVLGENGAGKTTLMNLCSGFLRPDTGSITLDGKIIPYGNPQGCRQMGIAMIHQHFTLSPLLTVEENLALPHLHGLAKGLNLKKTVRPMLDQAERLGWSVDLSAQVRTLPIGLQQRIEILKNLSGSEEVLIFDEPTAPLSPSEVEDLLASIRRLAEEGRVVILIAHKLSEVLEAADRITVLRKGQWKAELERQEASAPMLAELMVGQLPESTALPGQKLNGGELTVTDLQVRGDRGEPAVRGISFTASRGSIFGIGGVDGNGQLELAEAILGIRRAASGSVSLDAVSPQWAYIPGDRRRDGLALGLSVWENLYLGHVRGKFLGLLNVKKARVEARRLIAEYEISTESENEVTESLSGGNQQKVVAAREMSQQPDAVIAVNPARGLDIRAASFVHNTLKNAAATKVVVTISANLDELAELTDAPKFISRGQLVEGKGAGSVVGEQE